MRDSRNTSIRLWTLVALGGGIAAAWLFSALFQGLLIIFAGALLGIFLKYLADHLVRLTHFDYQVTFIVMILVLCLTLGMAFYYMGSNVAARVTQFSQQFEEAQGDLLQKLESEDWWNRFVQSGGRQTLSVATNAVSNATWAASKVVTVLGGILLILFLGFYFALQPAKYCDGAVQLMPSSMQSRAADMIDHSANALWKWMLGRLVGMVVIGVCSAVGLWAIGIPLHITLGVFAGLLNFIPNVGPLISVVPPLLFSLQLGGNTPFYVLLLYLILQFAESYFLTPLITQHQVSLPPGLTLSAQLLFGIMAGLLGLLLATPIVVVAHVIVRDLYIEDPR